MDVKIELKGIKEAMASFDPKNVRLAANSALNKVAAQAKTQISQQIREEYNVPAGKVSNYLRLISRAMGNRIEAIISGKGLGLALSYFGAKQEGVTLKSIIGQRGKKMPRLKSGRARGGEVSVVVRRSGGRKMVTGDPKPFIARFKSGHVAVVQRVDKRRTPLKEMFGPGVAGLMGSKRIMENTKRFINEKFPGVFKHEMDYYLKRK